MLNGLVGYQFLDDGTPISIGLLLISSIIIFVGTGYIALDTGFSWTGYWDDTLDRENQAYALYTLYQLVPLVFLVIFFCLEAYLVLRVLGERKPMRTQSITKHLTTANIIPSLPICCSPSLCHWPSLPIRYQRTHLHRHVRQDQRWSVRDPVHALVGRYDLGLLVEHHRGRLADANSRRCRHIHLMNREDIWRTYKIWRHVL